MLVSDLKDKLGLEMVSSGDLSRTITNCYIGDMLSVVMSKACEGDAWLTVQTNVNIVAVAVLTEAACIVVVEGMEPDEETVQKAKMQNVSIFKTPDTAFALACKIQELL